MIRKALYLLLLLAGPPLAADDEMPTVEGSAEQQSATPGEANGDGIESPKTMSGMSILGNEEAPKALVIVPWKSSELGNEITLADTLDARATPIDRDVFLRELRFHEIRTEE